jgi:hypothetical protein
MEVKVLLGRHIFDFAQHADWLGKRAFELRQPEHFTRKANDAYAGLLDSLKEAPSTGEKLSSLYDVILPGLVRRYEMYVADTDALLDAPSVLIMQRIATDLRRQIEDATQLRMRLDIATPSISGLRQKDDAISTVVA